MGKATILTDLGAGLYSIEVKHDTTAGEKQVAVIDKALTSVEISIAEEEAKESPDESTLLALNTRKSTLEKRKTLIETAMDADYTTNAWCADYSEGLTGDVGTIEPGTQPGNGINIQPGYLNEYQWMQVRDGFLTPFLTMNVADAMRNLAALPAIQKWRPNYRRGVITAIDDVAGICTVRLDALSSVIHELNINQAVTLYNVGFRYMSCNSAAFEVNDEVIIEFFGFDQNDPYVIGFQDNPRPCESRYIKIETPNAVLIYDIVGRRIPTDLPSSPPTWPALKTSAVNSWIAQHSNDQTVNDDFAGIYSTVEYYGILPEAVTANSVSADGPMYHIEASCAADLYGSDGGVPLPSECTKSLSFPNAFDVDAVYPSPYVSPPVLKSHTGQAIDDTYGEAWAIATQSCRESGSVQQKRKDLEWFLPVVGKYYDIYTDRILPSGEYMSTSVFYVTDKDDYASPSEHDRSFIVTSEGYGYTDWQVWSLAWSIYVVRNTYATLKFYSPFEASAVYEQELYYSTDASDPSQEIDGFNLKCGAKCGNQDIIGFCLFNYDVVIDLTSSDYKPDGIPSINFYSKCYASGGLDSTNLPNPYTECVRDNNLSAIVKDMVDLYDAGEFSGITIDFVDIT